jgi:bifunctional DNA-binding transcriptional regulator/antitoxin component of YhaV-PrlF toxin-antitoxin module
MVAIEHANDDSVKPAQLRHDVTLVNYNRRASLASRPLPPLWLDSLRPRWESYLMSATTIREKRETTLPAEVCEAAGLSPGDQVDWRIEDGEIRGRKVEPESCQVLDFDDVDPETLAPKIGLITEESIVRSIREDREQSQ